MIQEEKGLYYVGLLLSLKSIAWCLTADCDPASKRILVNGTRWNKDKNTIFLPKLSDALNWTSMYREWQTNTCIKLVNHRVTQYLQGETKLSNLEYFSIIGNEMVNVKCNNSLELLVTGLSITASHNISLKNLKFINCGSNHTVRIPTLQSKSHIVTTGLWFELVTHVRFENVHLERSYGYGIVLVDVSGDSTFDHLVIQNSLLATGNSSESQNVGYRSGGGLVMINRILTTSNQIFFNKGIFKLNHGEPDTPNKKEESHHSLTPFGEGAGASFIFGPNINNVSITFNGSRFLSNVAHRGGGVTFICGPNVKDIHVHFYGADFHLNKAKRGGGVFIWLWDQAIRNRFVFEKCLFDSNEARYTGGGVSVLGMHNNSTGNRIHFIEGFFEHNNATIGGGFYYSQPEDHKFNFKNVMMRGTQLLKNYATLGAAIEVMVTNLDLYDVKIFQNRQTHNKKLAKGALSAFKSYVQFYGTENLIKENDNTAIVLDNTYLEINNGSRVNITYNNGAIGGALSMFGDSKVKLFCNAHLYFGNNTAEAQGGALYVSVPGPPMRPLNTTQLNRYDCFLELMTSSFVEFKGNQANTGEGNSVFASTLQNCVFNHAKIHTVFTTWSNIKFHENDSQSVVTSPVNLKLDPSDWSQSPGRDHLFKISLLDERNNSISHTLDILFDGNTVGIKDNFNKFVPNNDMIEFAYTGPENENFTLTIAVPESGVVPQTHNLTLKPCPFGYKYHNSSKTCVCNENRGNSKLGIAQCFGNDLYLYRNHWVLVAPKNIPLAKNTAHKCPDGYCRNCDTLTGAECLYKANEQCEKGRNQESYLCSECEGSKSVHLRPGACSECHGTLNAMMEIIHVVFTFLATGLIIRLNKDTHANYLNSIIYSYQIIAMILPDGYNNKNPVFFITVVIGGSFNHKLFDGCYANGLNDLTRLWLYLLNPVLWIICYLLCYGLFVVFKEKQNLTNRDAFFRSLNTIFFICCCSVFKFAFNALKSVKIDDELRVFVYAKLRYCHAEHTIYFVVACILLALVAAICIMILISTYFHSYTKCGSDICCCYCFCYTLMPSLERSFKYGFKPRKLIKKDGVAGRNQNEQEGKMQQNTTFFSLFYVMTSCCVMAVIILMNDVSRLTIVNTLSLFFMGVFIGCAPYKEKSMNYFDTIFLGNNMIMVSIIDGNPYQLASVALSLFLFFPVAVLIIRLLLMLVPLPSWLPRWGGRRFEDIPWRLRSDNTNHLGS